MIIDYTPFDLLHREMNRLFSDLTRPRYAARLAAPGSLPSVNITEDEESYYVDVEVPGVAREDLDVSIAAQGITIKGERKPPEGTDLGRERASGTFTRSIRVGAAIDRDKATARLENGILSLTLPKAESVKPRKIAIES